MRRISEVSALTGISASTIYRWIRAELLDTHRDGRLLHVSVEAVRELQQRDKPAKTPEPPPDGMVTVRRAAADTGIAVRTIQTWAKEEQIQAQRHGPRLWYVDLDDCRHLAATLKPGPKPKEAQNDE